MNNFTYENTKYATEFYLGSEAYYEFFVMPNISHKNSISDRFFSNSRLTDTPPDHYVSLSRPHNETREYWTTNDVTQYAQPQGNNMNTIPAIYAKKITPLVPGDKVKWYRDNAWITATVEDEEDEDEYPGELHTGKSIFTDEQLVEWDVRIVSFADRPNTGTQPVGDGVNVYYSEFHPVVGTTASKRKMASEVNWDGTGFEDKYPSVRTVQTWKPNHAAMLKQYQAEQLEKGASERLANLNEAKLISHADMVAKFDTTVSHEDAIKYMNSKIKKINEKPTFTQAQADAGELPPIGYIGFMLCDSKELSVKVQWEKGDRIEIIAHVDGSDYSGGTAAVANNMTRQEVNTISANKLLSKTPIQTAEDVARDKLRDIISDYLVRMVNDDYSSEDIALALLASLEFTITLNSEWLHQDSVCFTKRGKHIYST